MSELLPKSDDPCLFPTWSANSAYSRGCKCERCRDSQRVGTIATVECVFCGMDMRISTSMPRGQAYRMCKECRLIDNATGTNYNKLTGIRRHGVSWNRIRSLYLGNEQCHICRHPVQWGQCDADHDHIHCPGTKGCDQCFRGFVHPVCNMYLGGTENLINMLGPMRFSLFIYNLVNQTKQRINNAR